MSRSVARVTTGVGDEVWCLPTGSQPVVRSVGTLDPGDVKRKWIGGCGLFDQGTCGVSGSTGSGSRGPRGSRLVDGDPRGPREPHMYDERKGC